METINLPLNGAFDAKIIEIADKFQGAAPGTQFKLCLFDTGFVTADAALVFHEIARTRPKGIGLHLHSHVCLLATNVLVWLAGDTRTLRSDAWIFFWEYERYWAERSEFQQFQDSLERRELGGHRTPFHENYLQIERLVKKYLPPHQLNRRVWAGELAEWNIIQPAGVVEKSAAPKTETRKAKTAPKPESEPKTQGVPYTPKLL